MMLFRLGFRPFFLLAGLSAIALIAYMALAWSGVIAPPPTPWGLLLWHQHEMLFGFATAVLTGFLLTAVPNWTGLPTPKGPALGLITLLWLLGRLAVFAADGLPWPLVAMTDAGLLLCLAAIIARILWLSGNKRNYVFVLFLLGLTALNVAVHAAAALDRPDIALDLLRATVSVFVLIMGLVGGRIIPAFTGNKLGIKMASNRWIEIGALAPLALLPVLEGAGAYRLAAPIALIAALANALRLARWHGLATLRIPLLWVLHAGYGWIVVGLALKALSYSEMGPPVSLATHAITVGAIGSLTLGVMSRATLGHTGRPLEANWALVVALFAIQAAALLRVVPGLIDPGAGFWGIEAAAMAWILAFGLFSLYFGPIFLRPRIDGRPG